MEEEIIAIYCICDDFLKSLEHKDRPQCKISEAEVMLIALVGLRFFAGNIERSRRFPGSYRYLSHAISKSRLNERLHALPDARWQDLLLYIDSWVLHMGLPKEFIIDSFPVAACHNIRISRCRLYQSEDFRGYTANKRTYFYGIKATVITTTDGRPVSYWLAPGHEHDVQSLKDMPLRIPSGSNLYADPAYLSQDLEDKLRQEQGVRLIAQRKANNLRPLSIEDYVNVSYWRKKIETVFSDIVKLMPKTIHAVTAKGFELKVVGFIVAFATTFILA